MGYASSLIFASPASSASALSWYAVQLVLNLAWTQLFFRARMVGWAMVELFVLSLAVVKCYVEFRAVDVVAAEMLVPYLVTDF